MRAKGDEQDLSEQARQQFLEGANADYARLRRDPAAWADELTERQLWDQALLDGLESNSYDE